jgi:hypothetical protein
MPNKEESKHITILEDKGLAPASSGTSMPKVKPPAKPKAIIIKSGEGAGDRKS